VDIRDFSENVILFDTDTLQAAGNGVGVLIQGGQSPSFVNSLVRGNMWGFQLRGGAPTIGDAGDSGSENTITLNTRGIYSNCGSPSSCPGNCSGTAVVRNNVITSNTTAGVYVDKRGFHLDLGMAGSNGKNTFTGNGYYCIRNASNCDTVRAVGNWFGSFPPTACWTGLVDVSSPLSTTPASRPSIDVVAVNSATGLRILAAFPNPSRGEATLRLETAGGYAAIGVEVYNVAGRLVRRLSQDAPIAGVHEMRWDGRDASGRSVSSGLYFSRARAGRGLEARSKILVTR